ncbi:hypothetical protein NPX13_g10064 [Xylaria arbuscula]|uniref:Translation machinery-associated protein 22 n=1 Tax=Xylaria arbuscula TaxID=114810 RepID=A0A9W8N5R8_9PEZI|nr:hypothetical protein NPX13_g10064 [Xylaria arbuscula]
MADTEQPEVPSEPQGRHVTYCGVCTLPPEYCEYGGTVKKCQNWLQKAHPAMYDQIWSAEALEAATASLSVEAQKRAAKDAQKKAAQAEKARAEAGGQEGQQRRHDKARRAEQAQKVSKEFGRKFATGSSVTKVPSGGEEIVVQGDVSDEIEEFLLEKYKDMIPEDNIEFVDDKKKKSSS